MSGRRSGSRYEGRPAGRALVAPHGSAKQTEAGDPMHLVGTMVPGGDVETVGRCLIEEFAGMGRGADEILALFRNPQYAALHPVYLIKGEAAVRRMIEEVLADCGVLRVTEAVSEPPDPCPQLIQIQLPTGPRKDDQR